MNYKESINTVGVLSIYKKDADGNSTLFFEEENLIVRSSKLFMMSQLYTRFLLSDPITTLKVGTGGNIDPLGLYPKVEDPLQTDLITPLTTAPATYVVNAVIPSVTFLADLDQSQGNGYQITEAGLFTLGGQIFNVKNHPGINKTADFSLHYSWAIKFL